MQLVKIKDYYGNEKEVNIDLFAGADLLYEGNVNMCFGGFWVEVANSTYMDIMNEINLKQKHLEEKEKEKTPIISGTLPQADVTSNNTLNKVNVRAAILTADFLDAESKIKMLVLLGV